VFNEKIENSAKDILTIKGNKIKVEKVDDHTIKFTLPSAFGPFLRSAGLVVEILPKHVYERFVKSNTFNLAMGLDSKPEEIVGTGPFMLDEYKPGQSILLKRNPRYWKKSGSDRLPYLDKISYSIFTDEVAIIQFQQGKIDYHSFGGKNYPILKPLEKEKGFTIYELGPAFGSNFITFNLNNNKKDDGSYYIDKKKLNLFRKKKFRKAIAHAIDKEFIIDSVFNSFAQIQYSPVTSANKIFFNTEVEKKFPYEYDPEKSKKLLEECGLKDLNNDGLFDYPDGSTVEFNLVTNAGNAERAKLCEIIRKDMETIGLKVNYRLMEFNFVVEKMLKTYDWDSIVIGFTGGIEPHFGANIWKSDGHLHMWHPKQKTPDFPFESEINQVFEKAVEITEDSLRKEYYDKWQLLIADNLPLIYTVTIERLSALYNKFGNIRPTTLGGVLHNITNL
ncbi:ABC transporter substrate-binding protein, partial [bacterium]|nr:ABC transporter substrate-binding protein [bacterium]